MKAPSGNEYTINGYVNEQNIVDRVETWLGENIMGDMHILATYTGWKDFGGVMAPSKIVQTRGGWPSSLKSTSRRRRPILRMSRRSQHSLRVAVEAVVVVAERPVAALLVVLLLAVAVAVVKAAALRLVLLAGLLLVVPWSPGCSWRRPRRRPTRWPGRCCGSACSRWRAGSRWRSGCGRRCSRRRWCSSDGPQPPEKLGEGLFRFTTGTGSYDSRLSSSVITS